MIRAESFKALEASLAGRLSGSLRDLTEALYAKIEKAIAAKDWDKAHAEATKLSLSDLFVGHEDYLAYVTNLAMLFGASRVTKKPGTSVVGLGFEGVTSHQMAQTFKQSVLVKGESQLREAALQLIALHKASPSLVEATKADTPVWDQPEKALEPSGRPRRILQPFSSFMDGTGQAMLNIASSLHTSRVSSYGFTAEAMALGLTEYQINEQLDSRTCPVCREMHGKRFKVRDARAMLDIVTRVSDPADIKQLQPWPKQSKSAVDDLRVMTPSELVNAGWHVPPFHPRCRGLLSRVGDVPTLEQLDAGEVKPPAYTASTADFEALGQSLSAEQIRLWNTHTTMAPADIVARLRGLSGDEFLAGLVGADNPAAFSGVTAISVSKTGINLGINAPMFDSSESVWQEVTFDQKRMRLEMLALGEADQGIGLVQKYMQRLYNLSSDLDIAQMELTANMELGGYAWAKYGFRPKLSQWEALKKDIRKGFRSGVDVSAMNPDAKLAMQAILESPDPASIYVLADMAVPLSGTPIGEKLLAGTSWDGELPLDDSEAMVRFLTYVGGVK